MPRYSREYPIHPIIGVGAVVLDGNKILLVKRGNEPYKGYWAIPGGIQRVNESLKDAALRELEEETGIKGVVEAIFWVDEIIERDDRGIKYHYVIIDLLVRPLSKDIRPSSDVLDARWFDINEALKAKVTKTTYNLLLHLKKYGLSRTLPYLKATVVER